MEVSNISKNLYWAEHRDVFKTQTQRYDAVFGKIVYG